MTFVQIIDCKTDQFDTMNRLMDTWVEQTKGKRTATHATVGRDRSDADHFIEMIEFPSYEDAVRNSQLPETDRIFQEMVALCQETPTFTDLDVVREDQLNKATARRFFEEVSTSGDAAGFTEMFTADYHDHDIANEQDTRGADGIRQEVSGYRQAFPDFAFTVDDQIAEGDKVTTRWSWRGTHRGDFRTLPASGNKVAMSGVTIFRFTKDGKIQEGWWNWDNLKLLREVGALGE
ncbi:ester cyclase [Streptomyces sp. NPDC000151]|uniref:ester cyclase n=1 Tax=Streptomyces sp. NPDC000151 TaxID=3154244 RepID=UPI0033186BE2